MASDDFTNDDGTALEDHDANWVSIGGDYVVTNIEINNNLAEHEGTYDKSGTYFDGSSEDYCQILLKAWDDDAKHVSVRAGPDQRGYDVNIGAGSGGNWTACYVGKNGVYLGTLSTGESWSQASDHTLRITASGTTTVTIEGFVDDVSQGTDDDSSSPIGAGHPGFWTNEHANIGNTGWDDWTDGAEPSSSSSQSTSASSSSSSQSASISSSSSSESISVSSSSSSESLSGEGWTWGEQNPDPETAVAWSVWKVKESANDARDSGDWGMLQLGSGEEFVSDVKDIGSALTRYLTLSYDDYASGSGSGTLYWRGQATVFSYDDDEVSGPTWEAYSPATKSWRYIQIKADG